MKSQVDTQPQGREGLGLEAVGAGCPRGWESGGTLGTSGAWLIVEIISHKAKLTTIGTADKGKLVGLKQALPDHLLLCGPVALA